MALIGLTIAYVCAGDMGQAQATAREILKLDPYFSVDGLQSLLYRDSSRIEHDKQALRQAGLP